MQYSHRCDPHSHGADCPGILMSRPTLARTSPASLVLRSCPSFCVACREQVVSYSTHDAKMAMSTK